VLFLNGASSGFLFNAQDNFLANKTSNIVT